MLPKEVQLILDSQVSHIEASNKDGVVVICKNGNEYKTDKVSELNSAGTKDTLKAFNYFELSFKAA